MPPKERMGKFAEGARFDRAVQQSRRDMANLRAKFGAEKVRQNNPDAKFNDFTKQPIIAAIRKFVTRRGQ